jgi:aminomethyltransferase
VAKGTPFHQRTQPLNQTGLWTLWAGYRTPIKYRHSELTEYFAVRNAAGLFDTSPLFKYRVSGTGAERFLSRVLARDASRCRPGRAQYTIWCDDRGFVIEDGLLLRTAPNEYWLTSAEPNLAYLQDLTITKDVLVEDCSDDFGILSIQGPASKATLTSLAPGVERLQPFGVTQDKIGADPVTISRSGYTGDLGYEIWVDGDAALDVFDALLDTGTDLGLLPIGGLAVRMLRIEAGLLLLDVDFESSRFAFTDDQRATPVELGYGWMFHSLRQSDRRFIGRTAIEAELATGSSRWRLVGIEVDWRDHERVYASIGMPSSKDHVPVEHAMNVYHAGEQVGFTTSFMYSPLLQRHIGLARVSLPLAVAGTEVDVEVTINHRNHLVLARVAGLPFFDPPRRRS